MLLNLEENGMPKPFLRTFLKLSITLMICTTRSSKKEAGPPVVRGDTSPTTLQRIDDEERSATKEDDLHVEFTSGALSTPQTHKRFGHIELGLSN